VDNKKKPLKNREAPGFGYDKSIDDLKVIGKNRTVKKNEADFVNNDGKR